MEKFVDPNAIPKEMDYYIYEDFKKFIAMEEDIKFKASFEKFKHYIFVDYA